MIQSYSVLAQSAVVAMTENQVVMINLENNKTTILNQGDKYQKVNRMLPIKMKNPIYIYRHLLIMKKC